MWWSLIVLGVFLASIIAAIVGIGFFLSPQDPLRKADMIVAVSGGETQQRTREAIRLYQQGYAPYVLFSGAAEDKTGPSNAAAMRQVALDAGVPASAILIEEKSTTTAENATESAPLIQSMGAKSIIMVTSPYHQRRASLNFRQTLGERVHIINHSATDSSWRKNSWWTNAFTVQLTVSELQKTLYVYSTKPAAQ